ncbi:amidase [Pseudooceanicola aestuarii]|uniref:amidase n=1 Tax=Pseudooceanicola aestuarii TaxID=2697319 RepID=UPI0013CF4AA2|nr:amidase [Pseudooceanicola aestuarii]
MTDDPALLPAAELVAAYAARRLSPVEVAQAALNRAEAAQPVLNAFCVLDPDAALADARAAEQRYAQGAPLSPVDGVPTTLKDLVLTRSWPTRRGSRTIPEAGPWDQDGPATARLREGGAVLLGKTTTPEFAFKPITTSPLTGITRNPWNPALTPGGSSGGAGASVAVGAGTLALGTDAGGSIRIPSSFCGVFGLKPSGGRVPTWPPTPLASLVSFGPMTRCVDDAARMLTLLARPDLRDVTALPPESTAYHQRLDADPAGWRIAFSPDMGIARVDPEVATLAARAAAVFADLGARVEQVEQVMDDPEPLMTRLRRGYTAHAFRHMGPADFAIMDPDIVAEIETSRSADLMQHLDAEMDRLALMRHMAEFHTRHDLLITPTLTLPPFSAEVERPDGESRYSWTRLCIAFNLTRQPAASIPCGMTRDGRPVGLQIVGPYGADLRVLQAARAFEAAQPWSGPPPLCAQDRPQ